MEIDLSKKLLLLLKSKERFHDVFNIEEFNSFINKLKGKNIPEKIVNYLYNYLYIFAVTNKIAIKYHEKTIMLIEINDEKKDKIYNFIVLSKIGDVKHFRIELSMDKEKGKIIAGKELHYSLDSCIPLIILNRVKNNEYDINDDINKTFAKEYNFDDFDQINFMSQNDSELYQSYSIGDDNQLSPVGVSKYGILKNKNLTDYTKFALNDLKMLGQLSTLSPEEDSDMIMSDYANDDYSIDDANLESFYEKII